MISIALYQPEIPPNTGNIIRLCANSGAGLHLIKPLGFCMDDKQLRRAGLDYHEYCEVTIWQSFREFFAHTQNAHNAHLMPRRLISLSTQHEKRHSDFAYSEDDICLFGSESAGLPQQVRSQIATNHRLTIPMRANSRSLNLSNSVAIVLYEAWRQFNFQ